MQISYVQSLCEIAAELGQDLRVDLGPAERAMTTGGGVLSLDPGPAIRLSHATLDQYETAAGDEIERRRLALVERWHREREGAR